MKRLLHYSPINKDDDFCDKVKWGESPLMEREGITYNCLKGSIFLGPQLAKQPANYTDKEQWRICNSFSDSKQIRNSQWMNGIVLEFKKCKETRKKKQLQSSEKLFSA